MSLAWHLALVCLVHFVFYIHYAPWLSLWQLASDDLEKMRKVSQQFIPQLFKAFIAFFVYRIRVA